MSTLPEHRAYKGCYVVIGHDQYDHSNYLVGHYISFSRAKKAARNKARMANALPASGSDIFCVYDSAGECRYRITFDDLPPHLQHPASRLDLPTSLPPPRPTHDRLFIKILLGLLVLPLLWWGKGFYDDMELSGQAKADYAQLRRQFETDRRGDCRNLDWSGYQLMKHTYERELQSPTLPRARLEYLQDKLRYYEDTNYRGPDVVGLLADFVRAELAHAQAGETVAPDAIYTANRNRYLATVKAQLPLREELGSYVNDQSGPAMPVVTNWDFRRLQRALALCEQIRDGSPLVVAFGYLLDGGSGKEVPLDGYEAEAFNKMITTALARQDVQQANALYQALLSYQVMNWYVYNDAVQDSITRYRRFLDDHALDRVAHAQVLESRLRKLNPHEYSQEYKHYRERTLRFLYEGLRQLTTGSAKNGNTHD